MKTLSRINPRDYILTHVCTQFSKIKNLFKNQIRKISALAYFHERDINKEKNFAIKVRLGQPPCDFPNQGYVYRNSPVFPEKKSRDYAGNVLPATSFPAYHAFFLVAAPRLSPRNSRRDSWEITGQFERYYDAFVFDDA